MTAYIGRQVFAGPNDTLFGLIDQTLSAGYAELRFTYLRRMPMTKRSIRSHRASPCLSPRCCASRPRAGGPVAARDHGEGDLTRKLDGSEAVVKMTVIDDKGQARERDITMATKLYDGGKTEKRIYRFLSPADVQGTWRAGVRLRGQGRRRLDLPARAAQDPPHRQLAETQSFMGSEFSYGDLNIPAIDDFDYKLVKQEPFGGETCYVIDVAPKSKEIARGRGLLQEDVLGQQGQVRGAARPVLRQGRQAAEGAQAATSSCSTRRTSATGRCAWR